MTVYLVPIAPKKKRKKKALPVQPTMGEEDDVEALSNLYFNLCMQEASIKRQYSQAFTDLENVQTEMESIKIKIQVLARKKAVQGKTVTLVSSDYLHVYVTGNQSRQTYDVSKASRHWTPDILSKVLTVDPVAVEALMMDGTLPEKVAEKAALPREARTPAVQIRVKKDKF